MSPLVEQKILIRFQRLLLASTAKVYKLQHIGREDEMIAEMITFVEWPETLYESHKTFQPPTAP